MPWFNTVCLQQLSVVKKKFMHSRSVKKAIRKEENKLYKVSIIRGTTTSGPCRTEVVASKHSSGNVGLNQKQVVLKSSAPKKIAKIQFATVDYKEMALCSELQVLHI